MCVNLHWVVQSDFVVHADCELILSVRFTWDVLHLLRALVGLFWISRRDMRSRPHAGKRRTECRRESKLNKRDRREEPRCIVGQAEVGQAGVPLVRWHTYRLLQLTRDKPCSLPLPFSFSLIQTHIYRFQIPGVFRAPCWCWEKSSWLNKETTQFRWDEKRCAMPQGDAMKLYALIWQSYPNFCFLS